MQCHRNTGMVFENLPIDGERIADSNPYCRGEFAGDRFVAEYSKDTLSNGDCANTCKNSLSKETANGKRHFVCLDTAVPDTDCRALTPAT
jgi:hypothetical protein